MSILSVLILYHSRLLQGAADDEIASAMKLINESQLIPMESQLYLQALRDNDQSFIREFYQILDRRDCN